MTLDLKNERIVVTGSAGFIGYHLTRTLLEQGHTVWGFDAVNDYYDVSLKEDRLKALGGNKHHNFRKGSLENANDVDALFADAQPTLVIHLAGQAGVRYSMVNPQAYIESNLTGFGNILEESRKAKLKHLVYASSSSVYGGNTKMPFSESDSIAHPLSLYAATKKSNELMAHSYSNLYDLPVTGLRFFTVYGPWYRPDMALYKFAKAISEGKPIDVYNNGDMRRDFTYIDDIVAGILGASANPPQDNPDWDAKSADPGTSSAPARVYNLGNNKPNDLLYVISLIEKEMGREAVKNLLPMQPGDVPETYADITRAAHDFGFAPKTGIEEGVKSFVAWFRDYYKV